MGERKQLLYYYETPLSWWMLAIFDQGYLFAIQACQLAICGFGSAHLDLTQALRLYLPLPMRIVKINLKS